MILEKRKIGKGILLRVSTAQAAASSPKSTTPQWYDHPSPFCNKSSVQCCLKMFSTRVCSNVLTGEFVTAISVRSAIGIHSQSAWCRTHLSRGMKRFWDTWEFHPCGEVAWHRNSVDTLICSACVFLFLLWTLQAHIINFTGTQRINFTIL